MLQRLPGCLEQHPVLWVHHLDLAGRHPEERRIEPRHVVDEARPAGRDLSGRPRIGVEELLDIPPVRGHFGDGIASLVQHIPEFGRIGSAGNSRCIADDSKT
jgi:hypothetical protein